MIFSITSVKSDIASSAFEMATSLAIGSAAIISLLDSSSISSLLLVAIASGTSAAIASVAVSMTGSVAEAAIAKLLLGLALGRESIARVSKNSLAFFALSGLP